MSPKDLLKEKGVLFNKYKELTLQQQTALVAEELEKVESLAQDKSRIVDEIQKLDISLLKEKTDQSSLEPVIREVLALEGLMAAELERLKAGLITESSNLQKGHRALKEYLQK